MRRYAASALVGAGAFFLAVVTFFAMIFHIDAPGNTDVSYYDPRPGVYSPNIDRAELAWQPGCQSLSGRFAAVITLYGVNALAPGGYRYVGKAVDRHITQGATAGPVDNGTWLGQIADNLPINESCWTGVHVHQGVRDIGSGVIFEHDTAGYPTANCLPYIGAPPAGVISGYPYCYQIRWTG